MSLEHFVVAGFSGDIPHGPDAREFQPVVEFGFAKFGFSLSEQALGLVQSYPERTRIDFKKSIGLFRSLTSCPTILLLSLSSVAALPDALGGVKSDATPCVDNRYPNANFAKLGLISLFAWLRGIVGPNDANGRFVASTGRACVAGVVGEIPAHFR